jgi:hypothetical protein
MKLSRPLFFFFIAAWLPFAGYAQELNVTVKVNAQKLQTVDPQVFVTLETQIREFLNDQKWTDDVFEPEERINCNLILTIQEERSATSFKADLAVQASRPVFNSNYETPLFNHLDKDVTFVYEQYQPLIFSRNSYNDNLSAVLSFYVYVILGLDYDSYSTFGGEPHFQMAQEILNNVPQSAAAANPGWRSIEGNRNRFWLIENILSPRVRPYRQAMYDYHRQALDIMSDDAGSGRAIMVDALSGLQQVDQAYPNSMIIQVFNNAKSDEIVEIFKGGARQEQDRVIQIMSKLDPTNASKYRSLRNARGS